MSAHCMFNYVQPEPPVTLVPCQALQAAFSYKQIAKQDF